MRSAAATASPAGANVDASRVRCADVDELAAALELRRGEALHLLVLHDETCSNEPCSCSPSYELERLTPSTFAAGQEAERKFRSRQNA